MAGNDEDDHGNDAATATPITRGSNTPGRIDQTSGRDVDWFQIDVPEGGPLSVRTTGSLDTVGYLYLSDGVTEIAQDDDSGEGSNFLIEADVRSGVHYVELRAYRRADTGPYMLVVDGSSADTARSVQLVTSASRKTQKGFLRIVNRSDGAGTVRIQAIDDAGQRAGSVTLDIDAQVARHFNSEDLESGNIGKGLSGGVGAGQGDWRLGFVTDLDILALAYIRTVDGFLTSVHDSAPEAAGTLQVAFFNPASNHRQRSLLRLVNPNGAAANVTIEGLDDTGAPAPGGMVRIRIPAGGTETLSASDLEHGRSGLQGALGDGNGKWRLFVEADLPIYAMSLMDTPTGNLTNLSTLGLGGVSRPAEGGGFMYEVPLFLSTGRVGQEGFLRVVNRSNRAGTVQILAFDDAGAQAGPVTLSLEANAVRHFNSTDFEYGNAAKGLSNGVGGGTGDWRLEITTDLDILTLAYVRTSDGFLTSVHDVIPEMQGIQYTAIFNPASNNRQRSLLRLVNPNGSVANVTLEGLDDAGASSPGGEMRVTVPAGGTETLSADDLENGRFGLQGALGDGAGKWQLFIKSDQPVHAMSLMDTPTGNLTNLSTVTLASAHQGPAVEEPINDDERGNQAGHILFEEDYESHVTGTLPADYIVVYNGAGDSEQRVEAEGGNQHLHTSGVRSWGLTMRKEFERDLPGSVRVTWRMRVDRDLSNYSYSSREGERFAQMGSFAVKNEQEQEAFLSINKYQTDGKIMADCPADAAGHRPELQLGVWADFQLDIDFGAGRYSIHKDGERFCDRDASVVDLSGPWHGWGERAGIRFASGNSGRTVTLFDDIVIRELE